VTVFRQEYLLILTFKKVAIPGILKKHEFFFGPKAPLQMNFRVIKADLNEPNHCKQLVILLDMYASDIMGGGEKLSDFTKENLAAELKKLPQAHVFIAYSKTERKEKENSEDHSNKRLKSSSDGKLSSFCSYTV